MLSTGAGPSKGLLRALVKLCKVLLTVDSSNSHLVGDLQHEHRGEQGQEATSDVAWLLFCSLLHSLLIVVVVGLPPALPGPGQACKRCLTMS